MARILDRFLARNANRPCTLYPNAGSLVEGLRTETDGAIRCLSAKIAGQVYRIGKGYGLVDEDIEELLCDCVAVFLEKMRNAQYEFRGNHPASFAIEIAKFKVLDYVRKTGKNPTTDIEKALLLSEEPAEYASSAQVEMLEQLLARLGENCRRIIHLKYMDELRDKDVVARKLAPYSTVDALKTNRAKCMKKLIELAKLTSTKP